MQIFTYLQFRNIHSGKKIMKCRILKFLKKLFSPEVKNRITGTLLELKTSLKLNLHSVFESNMFIYC